MFPTTASTDASPRAAAAWPAVLALALAACHPVGSAGSAAAGAAPARATVHRTPNAFRPTMTAVELASAFASNAAAAKAQFGAQPLLVTGVVAEVGTGTFAPVVHLAAGAFPALEVRGLAPDAVAKLAAGQQVLLACDGAAASGATVVVAGCTATQ